jgi:hypothetical protein
VQTTFELLHAAQDLIRDPKNWIQGMAAVDDQGLPVTIKRATCFCSVGALHRADQGYSYLPAIDILDKLAGGSIIAFNDTHTHAEVIDLWDRAKEIASAI